MYLSKALAKSGYIISTYQMHFVYNIRFVQVDAYACQKNFTYKSISKTLAGVDSSAIGM